MQYASPTYLKRSPYRLYRPYQLEIPQGPLVHNPSALYRNPNLNILSEINQRARRLERIVSYQKMLAVIQVLFSLLLTVLETTKILLIWEHFKNWEQKFVLVWEITQPTFFVAAAFVILCCILRPTKCTSQIAIASLVATLAPLVVFPTQSPFVINAVEAIHLNQLIERTMLMDANAPKSAMISYGTNDFERVPKLPILLINTHFQNEQLSSTSSSYTLHQLLSLQYISIAYAFFSFTYSVFIILALISYIKLLQLQ